VKPGDVFNPYRRFHGIWIPGVVVRLTDLAQGPKLLYGVLCRFAGRNGQCYPAMDRLAADMGVSPRHVQRHLIDLETRGLVRRVAVPGNRNQFEFLWSEIFEDEPLQEGVTNMSGVTDPSPVTDMSVRGDRSVGGGVTSMSRAIRKKRINKKSQEENYSLDQFFSKLWSIFPRHAGRAAALKAFKAKATPEAKQTEILAGLQRQLPELRSRETRFVPHLSAWLNQERWLEEPEPAKPEPESLAQQILREASQHD